MPAPKLSPEVKAMSVIQNELDTLTKNELIRVLQWLDAKYAISMVTTLETVHDNPEAYAS